MRAEDGVRIRHMIEASEAAIQFAAGRKRQDLDNDLMLLFAIVRAVEILGEAASKISQETQAELGAIPWKAIIGMRNRLAHAYFDTDAEIVWVAATVEIPQMLSLLRALPLADRKD